MKHEAQDSSLHVGPSPPQTGEGIIIVHKGSANTPQNLSRVHLCLYELIFFFFSLASANDLGGGFLVWSLGESEGEREIVSDQGK